MADENNNYQSQQDQIKKDAADKATSLKNQIDQTQSDLNTAKTDIQNTQSQISDTQNQITNLQNDYSTTTTSTDANIVSVPNGQIDKSKSLIENAARNDLWDNYYDYNQNGNTVWNKKMVPQNIYVSPDNDKTANHGTNAPSNANINSAYDPYAETDMVNTNTGMTESQMRELSILLLNELNHARAQRGLPAFVMTEDQFQKAMARAQQQSAANLDHNETDMNSALGSDWHSENLGLVDANADNMFNLLFNANNTISGMLETDADSDWGHRDNFLDSSALNAAFGFRKLDNGYYVMTFDTTYANDADKANDLVANTINNYAAMGPTKANTTTTPVDHSVEIAQLQSKLSDLNNTLATQQGKVTQLQNKLNDLNKQKSNIESDQASKLADAKTQHETKLNDLNQQISAKQDAQQQLKAEIEELQNDIANDQTQLDQLNKGGETPVETKKDNEKYTNLDPSLVVKVNVTAGDTNIPAPKLSADAFIKDTNANTASAAMFMVLAQTNGTYPEGTTVEWADLAKVQKDAQTAGTYDEEVILDFPDGSKSKAFTVPGVLVVAAKQTPSTDPDKPSTGDDTHTTDPTKPDHGGTTTPTDPDHGNTPSTNPSDQDQTTKPDDHQDTQPSDQGQTTPVAPAHRDDNQSTTSQATSQLPAGYKVVNNQVVNGNGNVVNDWKVVNGQAVPATREAYKAQQAQTKQLPQTGNNNEAALMGLGLASFASMLGLTAVNKKRN
ncbi:SEC10/PgrA surface exclusion domain-containing protein [Limosilactobacillus caecicola]|uniref:SEC10/PgrA surface exclusion domain-containing protein n=1 Tax=Limosilactobacillus caecicola TaxID=2941332 RepID=UPI002041CB21|nr:SEC10/PgrA surface exclusion domain-containing protein [Limosilactobacillus caecicola]